MNGIVTDIQRFSVFDGPGIRTTVFLKGCPLSCRWCHNPECISPSRQLRFYADKCVMCGGCAAVCSKEAHSIQEGAHEIDARRCARCGACVDACAYGAIEMAGKSMSAEAIVAEVLKDEKYYRKSNGGITLSGGEPTVQPAFACEILRQAREHGLHTAVESCAYAKPDVMEAFALLTDLWLIDMKAVNPEKHAAYTGKDNARIIANIDALLARGKSVILRCPIIPGLNDSDEDLNLLAGFVNSRPELVRVELMAYHHMGAIKYAQLGQSYELSDMHDMEEERRNRVADYLRHRCGNRVVWG